MNVKTIELEFKKDIDGIGLIDITRPVEHSLIETGIQNGIVTIYGSNPNICISTMEFEPGSIHDIKEALQRMAPKSSKEKHDAEERQDVRPVLIGPSITVPFKDNRLTVGKWQEIVLMDFDGVQNRKKVVLQVIGE
ncbi:MAG: YjbQ family protein [Candidatus Micrarchaeaceae archaeon]